MTRRLFHLMFRAHRALSVYGNARTHEELGISSSQLAALYHVAKTPGCSLTDVANVLDLNKSAVTGLVMRMERAHIVRRAPDPNDGRASVLTVTAKGEKIRKDSLALVAKLTAELTAGFSAEEMDVVVRFLDAVIARCTAAPPFTETDAD